MMRKAIFCLAVALTALTAKAQTNSNHLMVGVGTLYEKGLDATIAYEHGSKSCERNAEKLFHVKICLRV